MTARRRFRLAAFATCLMLATSLLAAAPRAAEQTPTQNIAAFFAHYTADWKSINVGTSDLELTAGAAPGKYLYTWTVTARGVFRIVYANDVIQKSWFDVVADHVRPQKYRAEDGKATSSIDFDWDAGQARGRSETKPVNLQITDGVQDIMSIQVEVMLDLQHGNLPPSFRILDKDEIKEFVYTLEGPAKIRTALGTLDTVLVSSHRTGGNRILRMWFAPSLGYVPVQAERSRDGEAEFTMKIKTLKPAKPAADAARGLEHHGG